MKRLLISIFLILSLAAAAVCQAEPKPRKPGAADKCQVCGMLVAKYTDFAAQLQFKDGTALFFDGPKDLFKYYLGLAAPQAGRKPADVTAVFVTSYYSLAPIDGSKAYYVTGSDVSGPMGRELIAFEKEAEAREFKKDHKGKAVIRFKEVSPAIVKELDR
ncbi:MAG: nitrous oxide reductase accessory protein NosL [Syntrophales bacterium]|nr:nitrous oxide reductase accessory protein NosL [Syntrophales bacterium]